MGKESELVHAIKNGDVSSIRKLLVKYKSGPKGKKSISKKIHVNAPDEDGFTALHHAALVNNVEVVLALIEMEADPNSRDKKGMCPLHMAAWAGKDQVVKALLDNRALVNLPSFSGETPLLLASQHGYANVVEVLMKYNADPTIRNNTLESPLDLACQFGHAAVARLLLMRGEVIHMLRDRHLDVRYKKPLHVAAKGGHIDVIRLLIESGADVNEESPQGTALHLAALYGKVDVVKTLLEAGADVHVRNKKNLTPLDMVNQFTTSRAAIEIKQLLREASGERVVYARAVTDNINVYDPTCLRFTSGETITILEQNEDGRWKGSIIDGQEERVGFFSAKSVKIISKLRDSRSLGSMSSSSDSSISSASSKEVNQPPTSPSRRMTDSRQPVGVVPIGSFEVLTLATGQTPEQKKPPNIPRLNSFKKGAVPARARKAISYDDTHEEQSNSMDVSMDSGVESQISAELNYSYDKLPAPQPIKPIETNVYDPVPPMKSQRNIDADHYNNQQANEDHQHHETIHAPNNYADIFVKPNMDKPPISPNTNSMSIGYSEVYVTGRPTTEQNHGIASNTVPIPVNRPQQKDFRESYERMNFAEDSLKYSRSPEEIDTLKAQSRARGYEDMTGHSPCDEPFPSPPSLPLKTQSFSHDENEVPLPPKKIESRAIQRRQDSYENVKPKQIVPVHAQNPFDKHPRAGKQEVTSQDQASGYGDYQNYRAPNVNVPIQRSNTYVGSEYENYRPSDVDEDRIVRAATVAEKPHRVPISRPVPLPPKLNRRSSQEPITPNPTSPAEASSSSPFFCQMNLDELQEDERELLSWLIDLKLPQYFPNFQNEGYDMISVRGIAPEDLAAVNITKAGHKKKLLSEIAKLKPTTKLPNYKPDDVGVWLELLGLRVYEENFIEGGFDDIDFIKDLDLADLEMIEIRKKGHQKKLLLAVQRLSDIELTADLDKVVNVSAANQPVPQSQQQFHQQDQFAQSMRDQPRMPESVHADNSKQKFHENVRVPPPPPIDSFDKAFLSNRDNLPPPSGTESVVTSHDPFQPVPPKAPPHFTQSTIKQQSSAEQHPHFPPPPSGPESIVSSHVPSHPVPPKAPPHFIESTIKHQNFTEQHPHFPPPSSGPEAVSSHGPSHPVPPKAPAHFTQSAAKSTAEQLQPVPRERSITSPNVPRPKPKPKPGQNRGQVRTASEYHAGESPSKSVIFPTPVATQKPASQSNGEEGDDVTASRSRDFWQQNQQQQQQPTATTTSANQMRQKSLSTGVKPITSPRPLPKPKPKPTIPERGSTEPHPQSQPVEEPAPLRSSVKKVPPPAPPRRDSMCKKDKVTEIPNDPETGATDRTRSMSGPLDEKIRSVFRERKHGPSTIAQAPVMEEKVEDVEDAPTETNIVKELEATDSIMADIDHMIADFTSQLDSMF